MSKQMTCIPNNVLSFNFVLVNNLLYYSFRSITETKPSFLNGNLLTEWRSRNLIDLTVR